MREIEFKESVWKDLKNTPKPDANENSKPLVIFFSLRLSDSVAIPNYPQISQPLSPTPLAL